MLSEDVGGTKRKNGAIGRRSFDRLTLGRKQMAANLTVARVLLDRTFDGSMPPT